MLELVTTTDAEIIQRLVDLEREAFHIGGMNEWHLVPLIRHGRVYVYKRGQEIVGTVQYMKHWDDLQTVYMVGTSVASHVRGQGVGTRLLVESLLLLAEEGITEVELTVDPQNKAAISIYENRLGFVSTEFRPNEYGVGEDRLIMHLALSKLAGRLKEQVCPGRCKQKKPT